MDAQERTALIRRYRDGHRAIVEALEGLSDDELDRSASVEDWLTIYASHGHDHAKQIERSRGRS